MRYGLLLVLFGVGLAVVHRLARRYGLERITYAIRFSAAEVTEGDTVTFIETICSRKPLPMPWLKVELTTQAPLLIAEALSAVSGETRFLSSFFLLRPYQQVERHWQVQCSKRGVYTVSRAVLVMSDLFGTMEQSRPVADAIATITVLPAQAASLAIPDCARQWMGAVMANRRMLPDRFAVNGIRPFQDGDNCRDICWSASARAADWMVYQYQDTTQPALTVVLQMASRATDFDTVTPSALLEYAIRVCNTCMTEALRQQIPVRFLANTQRDGVPVATAAATGAAHCHALQRTLAALPMTCSERFLPFLQRICAQTTHAAVLVVTACPDQNLLQFAAQQTHCTVFTVRPIPKQWQYENVLVCPPPSIVTIPVSAND